MNNLNMIRSLILDGPEEFGLGPRLNERDLEIEVVAPRFELATGRILYKVHIGKSGKPSLIVQSPRLWSEQASVANPYCPYYGSEDLDDVLPKPSGVINNGGRQVFWADFVDGKPLSAILHRSYGAEVLEKTLDRMEHPPWTLFRVDEDREQYILAEYLDMLRAACAKLPELQQVESNLRDNFFNGWAALAFSFSHGDIWCQDIIQTTSDQLCILDWEWVSDCRPFSIDLIDLSLSAIEVYYSAKQGESLACLINGKGSLESSLREHLRKNWERAGYTAATARLTIQAYLVWAQYRILLQTLYQLPYDYLNCGRALSLCVRDESFLEPLVHSLQS